MVINLFRVDKNLESFWKVIHRSHDIPYIDPLTNRLEKMDRRNGFPSETQFVFTCEEVYVSDIIERVTPELLSSLDPQLQREFSVRINPERENPDVPLSKDAYLLGELRPTIDIQSGRDLMAVMSSMLELRSQGAMVFHEHPLDTGGQPCYRFNCPLPECQLLDYRENIQTIKDEQVQSAYVTWF